MKQMSTWKISAEDQAKIDALNNPKLSKIIKEAADLMQPDEVWVFTDDPKDAEKIRKSALEFNEERTLATKGHTLHYDNYGDQGRAPGQTQVLLPPGQKLSRGLNYMDRDTGLKEIFEIMNGIMKGKKMIVRFFCLGPVNSKFSICAVQITDSFYVAHSEDLLYRGGYEQFKQLKDKDDFFYFWHSQGELLPNHTTKNLDKRRIYIDLMEKRVLSANNQYAGNSLACKKLALRLAIDKAHKEGWLAEHIFISAFYSEDKKRKTYFAGAYPSMCGKTSTAMIPGGSIVGDDIAYVRVGPKGEFRAANIERGIFGIIQDVNGKDDPVIFDALTSPREIIFSNLLEKDGKVYWNGMGDKNFQYPTKGYNHSGEWEKGNKDANDKEIPLSHPNARFTLRLEELSNVDEALHKPEGVEIQGLLYGGRDTDTSVPVAESPDWDHGVFVGATIESETTAATIGKAGVRVSNPFANMDFMIIPLAKYIEDHYAFGKKLKVHPKVYATNYFLKGSDGQWLNSKLDKKVWILWAEERIHGLVDAIDTPIGKIPKHADLKRLFAQCFNGRDYTEKEYVDQFSIRTTKYLEKLDRMEKLFKEEPNMPKQFWDQLNDMRAKITALKEAKGKDVISPLEL